MHLYSPKLFLRDWWIAGPLIASLVAQIFIWWVLIANVHPDAGQVFLHYNIIFGVDLAGAWWRIYFLPLAGFLVLLVNNAIAIMYYGENKFLARLLGFWVLFFHLLLAIGAYLLALINA